MSFIEDLKASSAIGSGDYDKAIEIYKRKLKENNKDNLALVMIAYCYEWKDDMEKAIEYANKALVADPTDFLMLLLAARYWSAKKDIDKTYHYACRAIENPPEMLPDMPEWLFWLFKPLFLIPKFRNLDKRMKKDINKHQQRKFKNLKWAKKYKRWYEAKYGPGEEKPVH